MELFAIILLGIIVVSGAIVVWMEMGITNDRLRWLEERLIKLEKDAVKVTFTEEPHYHGIRTTPQDVEKILNPKKDKVLGEWQTKNKTKSIIKRKPKTVKEWEDEIDLGGYE